MGWILDPVDRDAVIANVALKNFVTPDIRVILEMSCVRSPSELLAVKQAYHSLYKHSLEEDVASHTTGNFRKLLVALVSTYRYDGDEIDASLALSEAKIIHGAIKKKAFGHEEIIRILSTRSKAQVNATINCYKDEYGTSITKGFMGDTSDDFLAALGVVVRCIRSPHKYFAKVLHDTVRKQGADEDVVTRVIVTHAEKDLNDIMELYYKRNSVSLNHAVTKYTSGDHKAFLLTLLGAEDL